MKKVTPDTAVALTRGERNAIWIQRHCRVPSGPQKGQPVKLTKEQKQTLYEIYDAPDAPRPVEVTGELGAYVALLHTCGVEATKSKDALPPVTVDVWTLWSSAGPKLVEVLERDGVGAIICPALGTRFPRQHNSSA